jgi:hypothetical protein
MAAVHVHRGIRIIRRIGIGVLLSAAAVSGVARLGENPRAGRARPPEAAAAASGCSGRVANHRLDFWLGDWNVYSGGTLDGTNHIASILDGCAVQEEWTDSMGYQGRSWFYVDPTTGRLKQVWLTSHAEQFGGTKEKTELPGGGPRTVQFQGVLIGNSGGQIVDRTTLTLEADGTVRQVIEISKDGERTWTIGYDAIYRRCSRLKDYPPQI